ncbi:MAG: hypothetical protein RL263_634 [Bacteroidota bacterium]|jgi:hypothetical protein
MKPYLLLALIFALGSCEKPNSRNNDDHTDQREKEIISWFEQIQLPNGLMPSVENGTVISLYDNALAALVFIENEDLARAEQIFDFFDNKVDQELTQGVGGFSQFRNPMGVPGNHRWMGDNAWLLIAINHYHARTGSKKYQHMADEIEKWLLALQDADGGLFAGYDAQSKLLNYKVTEGNIDAFSAIPGYTPAHSKLLKFLKTDRWSATNQSLISWPDNPKYLYALDLHPWSYLIFKDFPRETLNAADRFINTQQSASGTAVTGYCFDEDKDAVWLEGTAQMCLALGRAGLNAQKDFYLNQIDSTFQRSAILSNAGGFPYATNRGTGYGADLLWEGADTKPCVSSAAWYLFAKWNFNPFEAGRGKDIPAIDRFW